MARGSISKRGDAFRIAVELPPDPETGKRRRLFETFHGTKKEADKRLTELLSLADQKRLGASSKMTVAEFLDYWLEHHAEQKAAKTNLRYHQIVAHQLKPNLGTIKLDKLSASQIVSMDKKLRDTGYAPQTRQHAHRVLHTALNFALALRIIPFHPMEGLKAPSVPKREIQTFSVEEAKRFLKVAEAEGLKWHAFFETAINTGMRVSELRGLRWQDVDFQGGLVRVRQNILRIPKLGRITKPTKNSGSARAVTVDAHVVEILKALKAELEPHKVLGEAWEKYDLVFPSEAGTPLEDRRIHLVFKRLCEKAEVKKIRPYDLRHCSASFLLAAGVHPKVVAERLGHSSVTLTLNTYSHLLPSIQRDAAETLGKLLE